MIPYNPKVRQLIWNELLRFHFESNVCSFPNVDIDTTPKLPTIVETTGWMVKRNGSFEFKSYVDEMYDW